MEAKRCLCNLAGFNAEFIHKRLVKAINVWLQVFTDKQDLTGGELTVVLAGSPSDAHGGAGGVGDPTSTRVMCVSFADQTRC